MSVAEKNGVIMDTFERSSGSQTKGNHRKPNGAEHPGKALYLTVSAEDDTTLDITRLGRQRHARLLRLNQASETGTEDIKALLAQDRTTEDRTPR